MADTEVDAVTMLTQIIALQDSTYSTSAVPRDVPPRQKPSYGIAIHQLDDLKTKNIFNLDDLETLQIEIDRHLAECNDHHFQITQYRLAFGAGNSPIFTCPDGSLNHDNSVKLDLATRVLKFDTNRAKSLTTFYSAQKEFFTLIEKFKEVEMEIQELLRDLIEHGITSQNFRDEMQESEARMVIIEESRVRRMEGCLEWLISVHPLLSAIAPTVSSSSNFVKILLHSLAVFHTTQPTCANYLLASQQLYRSFTTSAALPLLYKVFSITPPRVTMDIPAIQDNTAAAKTVIPQVKNDEQSSPEMSQTFLARFKNPEVQNKTREQLEALVQRYQRMEDERLRMVAEARTLVARRDVLHTSIMLMQMFHALDVAGLPKTDVLTDLSAEQLHRLNEVLRDDGDLGRMTWELYQIHKRMRACYDFAEELMSFREEHFHLRKEQEDTWNKMTNAIVAGPLLRKFRMEDTGDLAGRGDTTSENSRFPRGDLIQDKAKDMVASNLVTRIKDYKLTGLALAMENDRKAGEATWALYQIQKKLYNYCNACEDLVTILKEHFVCKDEDEVQDRIERLEFVKIRRYLTRALSRRVVESHNRLIAIWDEFS
ncbi:hypothetical protein M436DRAFT_61775 [Aureobasidium namibiae CBS 147.97]|uniref:Uncharacterized protein n=1 Tax=Aureobasidium namibiae CBS 147.97 TaxID=1043004 RepID=A0A074WQD4_9PEZI